MGACDNCLKCLIIFFNIIFTIGGLVLIVFGALGMQWLKDVNRAPAILIVAIGGIIFVVAICGFLGACLDNFCLLVTYVVLLIILLILQIAAIIAVFVLRNKVDDAVNEYLQNSLKNYNGTADAELWDNYQKTLHCCGAYNYSDWKTLAKQTTIPRSCCMVDDATCKPTFVPTPTNIYTVGCFWAVKDGLHRASLIVGAVVAAVAIFQLIMIAVACGHAHHVHRQKDYGKV